MQRVSRKGEIVHEDRLLPKEVAVAITIDGSTHAVMMASPFDLEALSVGLLYSEAIIDQAKEIDELRITSNALGMEAQIRLIPSLGEVYRRRKRAMAGPVGCGLCGIESLEELQIDLVKLDKTNLLEAEAPWQAISSLETVQTSRKESGALHAAALLDENNDILVGKEDIGRHNAIDKVIGAALLNGISTVNKALVVSSRISFDLVQKAARAGIPHLLGRATPSSLAKKKAQEYGVNIYAPIFSDEYYLLEAYH